MCGTKLQPAVSRGDWDGAAWDAGRWLSLRLPCLLEPPQRPGHCALRATGQSRCEKPREAGAVPTAQQRAGPEPEESGQRQSFLPPLRDVPRGPRDLETGQCPAAPAACGQPASPSLRPCDLSRGREERQRPPWAVAACDWLAHSGCAGPLAAHSAPAGPAGGTCAARVDPTSVPWACHTAGHSRWPCGLPEHLVSRLGRAAQAEPEGLNAASFLVWTAPRAGVAEGRSRQTLDPDCREVLSALRGRQAVSATQPSSDHVPEDLRGCCSQSTRPRDVRTSAPALLCPGGCESEWQGAPSACPQSRRPPLKGRRPLKSLMSAGHRVQGDPGHRSVGGPCSSPSTHAPARFKTVTQAGGPNPSPPSHLAQQGGPLTAASGHSSRAFCPQGRQEACPCPGRGPGHKRPAVSLRGPRAL